MSRMTLGRSGESSTSKRCRRGIMTDGVERTAYSLQLLYAARRTRYATGSLPQPTEHPSHQAPIYQRIEALLVEGAPRTPEPDGIGDRCERVAHEAVSYTHLRAHETRHDLVCRLLLEKKK